VGVKLFFFFKKKKKKKKKKKSEFFWKEKEKKKKEPFSKPEAVDPIELALDLNQLITLGETESFSIGASE